MLSLSTIGGLIADRRKSLRMSQDDLAQKAGISRATLDRLENARAGELGISKVNKILAALGLELTLQEAHPRRPTLDELLERNRNDQGLDRRR